MRKKKKSGLKNKHSPFYHTYQNELKLNDLFKYIKSQRGKIVDKEMIDIIKKDYIDKIKSHIYDTRFQIFEKSIKNNNDKDIF